MMTIKSTRVNSIILKDAMDQDLLHNPSSMGQVVVASIDNIQALRWRPTLNSTLNSDLRLTRTCQSSSHSVSPLETIELNPQVKFTEEERRRVNYLLELEQSNVISFNDLEYEVAYKVNKSKNIETKKEE